jgi:hypothetical protein
MTTVSSRNWAGVAESVVDLLAAHTAPGSCTWGDQHSDAHSDLFNNYREDMVFDVQEAIEQQFTVGPKSTYIFWRTEAGVTVDSETECGMKFSNIALILDPDSKHPALDLRVKLGIYGVMRMLMAFDAWRATEKKEAER